VAALSEKAVPFSEVSAHRATLERAYMELTRDAVEFRPVDSVPGAARATGAAGAAAGAEREGAR
jgi:ABC-2 type transport system ATP-binding protein